MGVPSKRPLVRPEVIEFERQNRQWGRVVPIQPPAVRITVWFIIVSAVAILLLLFVTRYARKETVIGYLAPAAGMARIFVPQQGIVSAVHVEQGQRVEEGQPLLSVTVEQIAGDGQDVNTTILATLERQRASLTRQMAAEEHRAQAEENRLRSQMRGFQEEIAHLAAQMVQQRQRIQVAERIVNMAAQLLPRGVTSELELRRREEALLEQRLSLISLGQQHATRQAALDEARFTLEQLPIVTAEKVQQLRNELTTTEQRTAEVQGRRAYIIRAPIAGRVSSLQASVGQVAQPQRLQLQIVPGESTLQAVLFIPARAIGFVEVGQEARLLYEAFPYQHYGTYRGRIVSVSHTIVTGNDIVAPVTLTGPAYRAIVALDRPDIDSYGKRVPLQPDMLLKADVILEKRTLVHWILDPLLSSRVQG